MSETRRTLPVIQPSEAASEPPIFEKIAILGLGLIGGSLALAARRTWPRALVIGVDDKAVLEQAMVLHAIDVAADDPVVIAEADVVVLAAPVRTNIALLEPICRAARAGIAAVVTDVGSAKRGIVDAARAASVERLTFIGGHPLGGAPRGGIEHARPDLFAGPSVAVHTVRRSPRRRRSNGCSSFVTGFGAIPKRALTASGP